jgi:predicted MFS family arabinose efflux permease
VRVYFKEIFQMAEPQKAWDTSYEWKAVTLLGLGFGLVGLDRWIIAPVLGAIPPGETISPMMRDLHLNLQDQGTIIGALGLAWGFFAILMGGMSDKIGRRKVLIPAIIGFSILSGLSGMATGLLSLVLIRTVMGLTEGSFCPTSFAATNDASHPKRLGINQGLQQCGFALFGLGFAPIIATQLLKVLDWRWIFVLVAVPGLILGILMFFVIREAPKRTASAVGHPSVPRGRWVEIFKSRNIVLSMFALFCAMTGVFVLSAMLPNYLTGYLKLTKEQMGFVASAVGFGGFVGQFALPGLSDILGRRIVAVLGFIGSAAMLYLFIQTGANTTALFAELFVAVFFILGLVALLTGPIATEAAPIGLISSAIGIVVGAGEIFGGGIAPIIAGFVAQHYGIQYILYLCLGGVLLGIVVCLFLKETAPTKVSGGARKPIGVAA